LVADDDHAARSDSADRPSGFRLDLPWPAGRTGPWGRRRADLPRWTKIDGRGVLSRPALASPVAALFVAKHGSGKNIRNRRPCGARLARPSSKSGKVRRCFPACPGTPTDEWANQLHRCGRLGWRPANRDQRTRRIDRVLLHPLWGHRRYLSRVDVVLLTAFRSFTAYPPPPPPAAPFVGRHRPTL